MTCNTSKLSSKRGAQAYMLTVVPVPAAVWNGLLLLAFVVSAISVRRYSPRGRA